MKKLLLVLFVVLATQVQSQNYCDSVEILITNQSLTSVTCSSNTNGLNTFWTSQDWSLTDKYGSVIGTVSGSTATFSMPNPTNSDTNYICLTSILSQPVTTIACNTCDTIVWNGANWILLSMMMPPPCNLTGGSVYIDHTSAPWMMNASVNGMSQYNYQWSNGGNANQTPFYSQWCVTILDNITGCDTTICQDCIADSTAMCGCFMLWMPVCGCDGVQYANSCVADCADIPWTPAISNGTPGGFLPCTQPSSCIDSSLIDLTAICTLIWDPVCGCDSITYSNGCHALNFGGVTSWTQGACNVMTNFACMGGVAPGNTICVGPGNYTMGQANVMALYSTMAACIADSCTVMPPPCTVEINNGTIDIEICDGDTALLEATSGFDTYIWTLASTGAPLGSTHIISVTLPGIYIVIATDIMNNCVDMDSIEVIVYPETPLNLMTVPNPPMVCLGDSVVIEVNPGFVNYWWNTGNPLDQGEDRVVIFPMQDFTYVVEALDANGCESREEIDVFVDTCATGIMNIMSTQVIIYPNPSKGIMTISLPKGEIFDLVIYDIIGKLILSENKVFQRYVIADNTLANGTYILNLNHANGIITKKIVIQ